MEEFSFQKLKLLEKNYEDEFKRKYGFGYGGGFHLYVSENIAEGILRYRNSLRNFLGQKPVEIDFDKNHRLGMIGKCEVFLVKDMILTGYDEFNLLKETLEDENV